MEEKVNEIKIISFNLDNELYGFDISNIDNIMQYSAVTKVPLVEYYYLGIINVRSAIIPLISMRRLLGFPDVEITSETRIIIIQDEDKEMIAFMVDSVNDISTHHVSEIISEAAESITNKAFIRGALKKDDRLLTLLDEHSIFSEIKAVNS